MAGFKAMYEAGLARPFRFIYFSAEGTPRDLSKKPLFKGDYQIMRVSAQQSYLLLVVTVGSCVCCANTRILLLCRAR